MKIETILTATDFSDSAKKAMETAIELAIHFDAQLIILHAYNIEIPIASPMMAGSYVLPTGFFEQIAEQARLQVESTAKEVSKRGVRAYGVALDEPAAQAIVAEAKRQSADMIVMGTRGLTGLKHIALGSVADKVVRTAPCPVLTIGHGD